MALKNWLLLLVLSFLWGTSFFFYEKLLIFVEPIQVVVLRLCLGAVFLLAYCIVQKVKLPNRLKDWAIIFVMGLFINSIPFTLFAYAQTHISASLASILNSNTAFLGLLVAVCFIKDEKLSPIKLIGIFIGLLGVVIAIGIHHITDISPKNMGQWQVVLATLFYALAGVWGRLKMAHLTGVGITTAMLVCSSLQILILAIATGNLMTLPINTSTMVYGFGIGLFCTAFAYLVYLKLIQEAGASNTALVTLLIPIVAINFNAITLNESLKTNEMIGFIVIFIGLVILNNRFSFLLKLFNQSKK